MTYQNYIFVMLHSHSFPECILPNKYDKYIGYLMNIL